MSGGRKQLNKNQQFKRQKVRDARTIRAEAVVGDGRKDGANELSESGGMLKVQEFISSREFEVRQLQLAMHKSKVASCTRVFQSLPRKLRRRTASHNVKRIPKRMRNRALREMLKSEQSTTNKSGAKGKRHKLTARQLYRAKMSANLLRLAGKCTSMKIALPANVTAANCNLRQKLKALRRSLKPESRVTERALGNRMGSYDNSCVGELAPVPRGRIKYCKRQRLFTWLPTHVWHAKRSHMIKRWGYQIPWSPTQKCFKMAHRLGGNVSASDGALCMDSSFYGTMVLRSLEGGESEALKKIVSRLTNKRGVIRKYRISKTWFEGFAYDLNEEAPVILGEMDLLWIDLDTVLIRLHPAVYTNVFESLRQSMPEGLQVEDCRYAMGSITLKGAKSLVALSSLLRSCGQSASYQQFMKIANVTDVSNLPHRTMFAFDCVDPRHLARPRPIHSSKSNGIPTADDVVSLQTDFPLEEVTVVLRKLCDSSEREQSYNNQQTLKELAKRRQNLLTKAPANQHKNVIPHGTEDPTIPILLTKRQQNKDWVLIMPWFWLLPFWHQLNRVSRVYHFGLRQQQQLNFESGKLYFPDDCPFTEIGLNENTYKGDALRRRWEKKPPSKRVNFEKISGIHKDSIPAFEGEIGDHFACDWKLLQVLRNGLSYMAQSGQPMKLVEDSKTSQFGPNGVREIQVINDIFELYKDVMAADQTLAGSKPPITLSVHGTPQTETRWEGPIQVSISQTPLEVIPVACKYLERGRPQDNARIYQIPPQDHEHWEKVLKGVYRADGKLDHEIEHPLPSMTDLIGFITSGAFHLGEGRGVAHGFVDANCSKSQNVLIRNVGSKTYRLASWTRIDT